MHQMSQMKFRKKKKKPNFEIKRPILKVCLVIACLDFIIIIFYSVQSAHKMVCVWWT